VIKKKADEISDAKTEIGSPTGSSSESLDPHWAPRRLFSSQINIEDFPVPTPPETPSNTFDVSNFNFASANDRKAASIMAQHTEGGSSEVLKIEGRYYLSPDVFLTGYRSFFASIAMLTGHMDSDILTSTKQAQRKVFDGLEEGAQELTLDINFHSWLHEVKEEVSSARDLLKYGYRGQPIQHVTGPYVKPAALEAFQKGFGANLKLWHFQDGQLVQMNKSSETHSSRDYNILYCNMQDLKSESDLNHYRPLMLLEPIEEGELGKHSDWLLSSLAEEDFETPLHIRENATDATFF
jgi:hypothetical protein